MKLEDQVCSRELARQLKLLGVPQISYATWFISDLRGYTFIVTPNSIIDSQDTYSEKCAAFTVAELGAILPHGVSSFKSVSGWKYECVADINGDGYITTSGAETEADVRAKMLIHLLQNKLMELPT